MVWDLGPVFTGECPGGFAAGCRDVAALVLGTLQDCTEWYETVVFHDWVHPSCLFRPHNVDEPDEVPGWDVGGLFPNGDYTIFSVATTRSASSATRGSAACVSSASPQWRRSPPATALC